MNEQQQAAWGLPYVLLAFPDPGIYEQNAYRRGEYEQIRSATHILQSDDEEITLCGRDASQWQSFEVSTEYFTVEAWAPEDFEGLEASDRACATCTRIMKRIVSTAAES